MVVLLLGGSGKLGIKLSKELSNKNITFYNPDSKECNITDYNNLEKYIIKTSPDIILHSAGFVDTKGCEEDRQKCLDVNVLSTYYLAKICRKNNIRLVYISSEYVFNGADEEYTPNSSLNPISVYGLSKASSEFIVKTLKNYLIIRSPFVRYETFPYEFAFTDQYTSRQYLGNISEDIITHSLSSKNGVIHIVGKYQSLYDLALETNPNVLPSTTFTELRSVLPLNLKLVE